MTAIHSSASPTRRLTTRAFLTVATITIGAAAVLLHLLGFAVHSVYLGSWGVNAEQFPKATDWLIINGYYAFWRGTAMLFVLTFKNALWVALCVALFLLYLWVINRSLDPSTQPRQRTSSWPQWLKRLLQVVIFSGGLAISLIPLALAIYIFTGVPARLGQTIGEEIFRSDYRDFYKGCEKSRANCIKIFKGEKEVGQGYFLASSDSHLAYFDAATYTSHVLPLGELELRTVRPPEFDTASK
ncbi:hypothetical protein G7048_21505 [Diaphorobacter sp. HDW4B]|uniref:hypothetical protein n=1 Tax=Diaphorobacter sp. HDW4B TaxID=2714925 RepID=UPI0014081B1F|nr:hypothetical protein [Diaphorobacter sp. HDW4B]QIL72700.1 hypothetical protein G7048_21505 [Diaphorobacter sp. HDW4B]